MHRPSLFSMVFYRTSRPLSTMNFYFFLHISVIPGHTDAVPAAAAASQQKGGAPHGGAQKHQERAEHQRAEYPEHQQKRQEYEERQELQVTRHAGREPRQRPPDTRKHTVLPVSIRLKSTAKTPTCVSMRAFLQPISARIYFGKTASHRKRARFVQSRGAPPQAYWMSVKAAQRWGCAKRAFCGA